MSRLIFEAAENLGYRLGVRLRYARLSFGALPGIWFIGGHGYIVTDLVDDNMYSTLVIDHHGKALSRRALRRRGIEP